MTEPNELITEIISGVLTGGAGAATTLLGVFRKTKQRIRELEEAVGKEEPIRTGLFLTVFALEETVKKIKREMESWEDSPPKWAERLMGRARTTSSTDLAGQRDFEERIERMLRSYNERLTNAEDDIEKKIRRIEDDVERELAEEPTGKLLTRDEYIRDSQQRAEEMLKIREQLATANGLLRGVMATLGIIDPMPPKPPKLPPRPGR
jgi:chromosome segregation ATPase